MNAFSPGRLTGDPMVPAHLARLEVRVTVEVGSARLTLRDLMTSEPGRLLALDRGVVEPVDLLVNGQLFARGEIVALGDRFGVRLTEVVGEP